MPPPSPLTIATSALVRLTKEKASYHKEHAHQEATIAKLESAAATSEDENAEYVLRQERKALSETAAMFPQLRSKIEEARSKLQSTLDQDSSSPPEDIAKAKEALAAADDAIREDS